MLVVPLLNLVEKGPALLRKLIAATKMSDLAFRSVMLSRLGSPSSYCC